MGFKELAIVTEWKFEKDETEILMRDITNNTEGPQLDPSRCTYTGLDDDRLSQWYMRDWRGMIVEHLRRLDVGSLVNDDQHSAAVESSIISNILSMDFDGHANQELDKFSMFQDFKENQDCIYKPQDQGITDAGMTPIGSALSSLQSLDVSYCRKLSEGLSAVAEGCHGLKSLHLTGCHFVTDKLLESLSENYIGISTITEACSTSLRTLKLLDCYKLGDKSILAVANLCKKPTFVMSGVTFVEVFPDCQKFIQLLEKFEEGFINNGLPGKHDYEKGNVSRDIVENSVFKDEKELICSNRVAANELLVQMLMKILMVQEKKIIKVKKESVDIDEQVFDAEIASTQALIDAVTTALPSPPLPPSLYIPPPVDHRDEIPESEQPPRKRLYLSTLGSRYEVGESSTARPTRGRGIDYGFVSMVDAEERQQGIRDVGYGIRDTWEDPAEAVPEIAPMTVGEVNTRVTEHAELHEHDTQDLYALLEDAQDRESMDGGGGGLCFPRGLGSLDRIESGDSSGASDPS
ncbi:retrotransposon protein, putative, ty3-gypsy subclass [Tanacetum coccineum]|uniref:Retrotransposon protein, putative, ty3-gypsy subclass n=1 Tax=Tanacetum coccineum TaxID=301880 RepID=A0ABQ5F590_9ASTR